MIKYGRTYVAGHRGLVGSAILRRLRRTGHEDIIVRTRHELDLTNQSLVSAFFVEQKPQYVVLAAARVGGILSNSEYPADFIRENLLIQTNVIRAAYEHGVRELLFLGSSCIYPRDCPQPIREEYFMTGPLERTNSAYAVAKIAGIEMCHAYNRQYGTHYLCLMPTNLYGPEDNFDLETSHVLPAMIRKFHEAKAINKSITLWGTGRPRREFLHVDDLADACCFLMEMGVEQLSHLFSSDAPPLLNIGSGHDLTIQELAAVVAEVVDYDGAVQWDSSKPDGTPRKLLDVSRMQQLGWNSRISLPEGVKDLYQRFQEELVHHL
jgi:GDP-L-fucose synthase